MSLIQFNVSERLLCSAATPAALWERCTDGSGGPIALIIMKWQAGRVNYPPLITVLTAHKRINNSSFTFLIGHSPPFAPACVRMRASHMLHYWRCGWKRAPWSHDICTQDENAPSTVATQFTADDRLSLEWLVSRLSVCSKSFPFSSAFHFHSTRNRKQFSEAAVALNFQNSSALVAQHRWTPGIKSQVSHKLWFNTKHNLLLRTLQLAVQIPKKWECNV